MRVSMAMTGNRGTNGLTIARSNEAIPCVFNFFPECGGLRERVIEVESAAVVNTGRGEDEETLKMTDIVLTSAR